MAERGFTHNHRTGETVDLSIDGAEDVSFRDVVVDPQRRTITLRRPLVLDLGAVAKGLAIDLAARELASLAHFAIDAGGDLYLAGRNERDQPWRVGIRHPRQTDQILATLCVSNLSVCTSGDYERPAPGGDGHHIVDPRTGESSDAVASVTVVAPSAVLADALGTAAFVLGVRDGLNLLAQHGVEGLIVTTSLEWHATQGMLRDYELRPAAAGGAVRGPAVLRDPQGAADDPADDTRRHRGTSRGRGAARSAASLAASPPPRCSTRSFSASASRRGPFRRRDPVRHVRGDGPQPARAVARHDVDVARRRRQQVPGPRPQRQRLQPGGTRHRRDVAHLRHGPELVGGLARTCIRRR
jgi:hypothetical protein